MELGQGEKDRSRALLEEGLTLARNIGHKRSVALMLNILGELARIEGDHGQAMAHNAESLALSRELGNRDGVLMSLHNCGFGPSITPPLLIAQRLRRVDS